MPDQPQPAQPEKSALADFAASAAGDAASKFYVDVVDYRKTDDATKAKMDALIATIDIKDLNTITTFSKEPAEVLRKSSEDIVKRAQSATTFLGSFAAIKDKLEHFDFTSVGKMAADYAAKIDRRLSSAALTWKNPIKKIGNMLSGHGKDTTIDDIRVQIDKSLLQLADVVADLEGAKDKIPGVVKDLSTLETARLNAYSDYGLYVGAAVEKYRRTKEEMPKLEQEATDSPLKQSELRQTRLAMTVLNEKVTDMDTFHKTCLVQLKTIDDLQESLAMCQVKIDSHLTISQGQWTALLAEAAVAAETGQIAESVKAADQFGDKIFEQSQKLSDMTKVMARDAFSRGTLDPVKVVANLQKRTAEIQEDLQFVDDFNKKMEAQRDALDAAGREFRDAAIKVTQPRATGETAPAASAPKAPGN
jgi:uncharacterized protein YaaN involved in tellurite resistance